MISLFELLYEQQLFIYEGMIRVTFNPEENVTDIADIIRGIEGVTIVSSAGDSTDNKVVFKIKVRSFDSGEGGEKLFIKVREEAIKHQGIQRVELATKTIQRIQ